MNQAKCLVQCVSSLKSLHSCLSIFGLVVLQCVHVCACVCLCVCVCVCLCVCLYVSVYVCVYVHACVWCCVCASACVNVYRNIVHIHYSVQMHTHIQICSHTYTAHTGTYGQICKQTHTHTHTQNQLTQLSPVILPIVGGARSPIIT